jgi:hypothetical protein
LPPWCGDEIETAGNSRFFFSVERRLQVFRGIFAAFLRAFPARPFDGFEAWYKLAKPITLAPIREGVMQVKVLH